jgi:putative ABC transport system permease protein
VPAVWFRFRADLRTRWRGLLGLALLAGLVGGVALAAAAGARRTDSAYSRLVAETRAWDVLVNPDNGAESALSSDDVAHLREVAQAGRVDGLAVVPRDARTQSELFNGFGIVLLPDRAVGRSFGRLKLVDGRMPGRDRPNEVVINQLLAERRNLHVGDRVRSIAFDADALNTLESGNDIEAALAAIRDARIGFPVTLRVTGIGVTPDDIVLDQGFQESQMTLSPAFATRYPDAVVQYWGEVVRLRRGSRDLAAFRRDAEALVPEEAIAFQTQRATASKVERAVRPYVGALGIFAVVVALTGAFVIGQALARQSAIDARDHPALSALGFDRSQRFGAGALGIAIVGAGAAIVAGVVMVALSPLTPFGPARTAEPQPGLHVDGIVLGLGMLGVALGVAALGAVPAWRAARVSTGARTADRPSTVARTLATVGAPAPLSAGVRMALEPGRGRTAVPVRTTIVGASLALATVVASLGVAASIHHLVDTPRLFGWNWDAQISAVGATIDAGSTKDLLDGSKVVERWSVMTLSDIRIPGGSVPALGIDTGPHAVPPSLVSGRAPRGDDEIAMGTRTLRTLGLGIGDRVPVTANDGTRRSMHIVGKVVLPGLGTYPGSDKTALGEGAVVARSAIGDLGPAFERDDLVLRFRPGTGTARRHHFVKRVGDSISADNPNVEDIGVRVSQLPADVISYDSVRSTPLILAAVLALLAIATVTHALVIAIRRRRRDLALLGTLGFTRQQVAATVLWQATTVAVLAIVVGIPLGIVAGRIAWDALANDLGTVAEPRISVIGALVAIPAVLLVTNAIAYLPGRVASRMRPAVVLRSE